jgi:hypothetical protein
LVKLHVDLADVEAGLIEAGIRQLPVTWTHAHRSYDIAQGHPDPFGRPLLAQAICEPLHLLTGDQRLARYSRDLVINCVTPAAGRSSETQGENLHFRKMNPPRRLMRARTVEGQPSLE